MKKLSYIYILVLVFVFHACNTGPKVTRTDTETSGVAYFVADESFAPVINEQMAVFESLNTDAVLMPSYTSEQEAYNLLMTDSVQLLFGTRELTDNELQILKEKKKKPRTQIIARDGVAIIVNKQNPDSMLTVKDLKRIMTGEAKNWKDIYPNSKLGEIAVSFDTPNSSIVRYAMEEICEGQPLGENVRARSGDGDALSLDSVTPNQRVIDFVSKNPNALGLIGVNWISNPKDSTNLSFINKVQVVAMTSDTKAFRDNTYRPYPYQLALEKYPLRRNLYVIITDVKGGLPSGFVKFVAGEQGQRIVLKSGLVPGVNPTRLVRINATAE